MTEAIGTAYLNIEVRTDSMQAGLSTAKRSVSEMSAAAQAEYNKLSAAQKRAADSAINYAQNIGKARDEIRALNAEQRIGGQLGKEIAATIRAQAAAQQTLNTAMGGTAVSARQTAAALRGVPAQLTDIFVSLQGGQNPMTVLFQQGGQLRDMFGSTGAAARALGSSIMGLVNPYTVAAAAVLALGLAWKQASDELEGFNRAIVQAGLSADLTAAELSRMASALDESTSATQMKASDVLTQVAATGRFTADEIQRVAKAAIDMEDAFGQSVEKTIQDFVKLKEAPSEYILKLNETGVVTRFLTEETLAAIKSLEDQGREADAARLAIDQLGGVIESRSATVVDNLGAWSSMTRDLRNDAKEAADEFVELIRRMSEVRVVRDLTFGQLIANSFRSLVPIAKSDEPQRTGGLPGVGAPIRNPADLAREAKEREEAERRFAAVVEANLSRREQLETKILKIKADGLALGKEQWEIEAQVTAERKRFAEEEARRNRKPKPKKTDAQREAEQAARTAQSLLERIQQQVKLNEEAARSTDELTASERLAVTAKLELDKVSGKVQASQRQEIEAALEQLRVSGELVEAQKAQKELAEDLARARTESAMALLNQARANSAEIAGLVLGRQALDQATRRLEIEREFEDKVAALRRDGLAETSESFREQVAIYARTRDEMLAKEEEHQRRLAEVRADWRNGARSALEDYASAAADVAGQTYDLFSGAMQGLEDVLTEFFTKGKADWRAFADSIAADFTRMIIRQQLARLAEKFIPGMGGDSQAAQLAASAGQLAASGGILLSAAAALTTSAAALAAAGMASAGSGGGGAGSMTGFGNLIGAFMSMGGYASGGYTGPGSVFQPAGVVHKGEVVFSQSDVARLGGWRQVEAMRRGSVPSGGSMPVARRVTQVFNTNIQGRLDSRTEQQLARTQGREAQRAIARNS